MLSPFLLLQTALITLVPAASAQTFFCSAFSVTNIHPDTVTAGVYQLSIQCVAGPNEFVSYPIVSAVVDGNGDTVATGGLFYFGQFGQTTLDYPVTLTGNGSMTIYPLTAYFIINYSPGFTDTCQLYYGTSGLLALNAPAGEITIYPNPAAETIRVAVPESLVGSTYSVVDISGRTALKGKVPANTTSLFVDELPGGTYFIVIGEERPKAFQVVKK
jgi:hypothetical protein